LAPAKSPYLLDSRPFFNYAKFANSALVDPHHDRLAKPGFA
jgi:hypothetical protein